MNPGPTPIVSVIVPCFRQARFLPQALDSLLAQTYPSIEIIVVNDGSDDGIEDAISKYRNRMVYLSQRNQGLSAARNMGLRSATGRWVLFLDADDMLVPTAIHHLVRVLKEEENSIAVMGYREFEEDPTRGIENFPPAAQFFPFLIDHCFGPPHCILSPRNLVMNAGAFDVSLNSCEDWDLWIRLGAGGARVIQVPVIGALYRQHATSMSKHFLRMLEARTRVLIKLHDQVAGRDFAFKARLRRAEERLMRRLQHHLPQSALIPPLRQKILSWRGVSPLAVLDRILISSATPEWW